jgi:hypothetical protein
MVHLMILYKHLQIILINIDQIKYLDLLQIHFQDLL